MVLEEEGPISESQTEPLLLSLMLLIECVVLGLHGKQSADGDPKMQNKLPDEQVDAESTVLPNAKFSTGGKQPALLEHCPLQVLDCKNSSSSVHSSKPFLEIKWLCGLHMPSSIAPYTTL